MYTA
ncbi:hypothetical protein LDBPK_343770 [Leishmania donovani]|jgi:exonuclease VII large subunit